MEPRTTGRYRARMYPLEPTPDQMREIGDAALGYLIDHIATLPEQPTWGTDGADEVAARFAAGPPGAGAPFAAVLARLGEAVPASLNTASPGYLAFIPGGGLFTASIAAMLADGVNRYIGMAFAAPALAQIETSVLKWMCGVFDLPPTARGILTTGGSMANFSAIVTARHARLGEKIDGGTIYVQSQTHHSVAKSAVLAGIPARNVRTVPSTPDLRMDTAALELLVKEDRAAGLRPFAVVASLGTTNTGVIDDLEEILAIGARNDLWVHADGAYGGFFQLTARGRAAFAGVERADSITLDPHKGMFLPYGTGALLVRDGAVMRAAHTPGAGDAAYIPELDPDEDVWTFSDYSPELSRGFRGLKVWLPLQVHGADAFRAALDEKLDLARVVYDALVVTPGFEVLAEPALSTVGFRYRPRAGDADAFNRMLLDRINASRRIYLSPTTIDGTFTIRVCVVSHRTHRDRVDEAVDIIRSAARELDA